MSDDDSKFIQHEPCPKCGSKDNLARYSDGHAHCFTVGCGHYEKGNGNVVSLERHKQTRSLDMTGVVAAIPDRRISQSIASKYGVTVEFGKEGQIVKKKHNRI
jgi:twinkle protein